MAVRRRNSNTTVRLFRNKTAGTLGDSAFFKLAGDGNKMLCKSAMIYSDVVRLVSQKRVKMTESGEELCFRSKFW